MCNPPPFPGDAWLLQIKAQAELPVRFTAVKFVVVQPGSFNSATSSVCSILRL
jgi:hypothetical protein